MVRSFLTGLDLPNETFHEWRKELNDKMFFSTGMEI